MNKFGVFARTIGYKAFRSIGWPKILPINLTVSLTYRCNSKCKTCNVWKRESVHELNVDEFAELFKKIGPNVYWFTLSGGEPFLRNDIVDICQIIYENCNPAIINIPTNGLLVDIIPQRVEEILETCPDSKIVVNVSMDGIGGQHDNIRGVDGNFKRVLKTYDALRLLDKKNFELGIHSVVSVFNVKDIPEISHWIEKLEPDSYITEIAEEREELGTIGEKITPCLADYAPVVDYLSDFIKKSKWHGTSKLTQAFRLEYYQLVKRVLKEKRQIIPCFAGFASAQIAPNGDVWTCCIRAEPLGNLRENNYDFKKIWFGNKADKLRQSIKSNECYCPLANASYTNMVCNFRILARVARKLL